MIRRCLLCEDGFPSVLRNLASILLRARLHLKPTGHFLVVVLLVVMAANAISRGERILHLVKQTNICPLR